MPKIGMMKSRTYIDFAVDMDSKEIEMVKYREIVAAIMVRSITAQMSSFKMHRYRDWSILVWRKEKYAYRNSLII